MKRYVVGFAYSTDRKYLALIRKEKPEWQKGKWNGVGGKIEEYDISPQFAMSREFEEETGVGIPPQNWTEFCYMTGDDFEMYMYKTFSDDICNVKTTTDEVVAVMDVQNIPYDSCISNLSWVIPMSLEVWLGKDQPWYEIKVGL